MAKIIEVTAENKIDTRLFDSLLKEYRSAYEQKQKLHDLDRKSIIWNLGNWKRLMTKDCFSFYSRTSSIPYCCILKQRSPESSLRPVFLYQKTVRTRPLP